MEDKIITDEYLSVKAFADRAGISTQRVYQLLAKDLQDSCKVIGNTKFIHISALERFTTKPICKDLQANPHEDLPSLNKALQEQIETLKQHNALLSEQLSVKDAQLSEKDKQISALTSSLQSTTVALTTAQESLQASQALQAGYLSQQLTERSTSSGAQSEGDVISDTPLSPEPERKRGFFSRLFDKKR